MLGTDFPYRQVSSQKDARIAQKSTSGQRRLVVGLPVELGLVGQVWRHLAVCLLAASHLQGAIGSHLDAALKKLRRGRAKGLERILARRATGGSAASAADWPAWRAKTRKRRRHLHLRTFGLPNRVGGHVYLAMNGPGGRSQWARSGTGFNGELRIGARPIGAQAAFPRNAKLIFAVRRRWIHHADG